MKRTRLPYTQQKRGVRVLICGGRDYPRAEAFNLIEANMLIEIESRLECPVEVSAVIHGGASGADQGAGDWGRSEHVPVRIFPAEWKAYGKAAGPIRNQRMLTEGNPDVVVALPGGKGTENMIRQAEAAGVPVVRLR